MDDWQAGGFGLYLHWPFCAAKCPYCDFNSHVAATIDHNRWARAYRAEIARVAALTGPRVLNTVFFGGGTPSLMPPDLVADVLDAVRAAWPMANDAEITLEANPTSAEAGRFAAYAQAGVNRVSVGIQALDDASLRRLGRLHSAAEGLEAWDMARRIFPRASFDLIYARQDQSLNDWRAELTRALERAPDHLSLYQLTIEPGTAFGDRYDRGKLAGLPSEDLAADLFDLTQDLCGAAGLPAYEVSNHARDGHQGRHNLIYWRYGDYAGIGPGAHGRLTLDGQRRAHVALRAPGAWLAQVERRGHGEDPADPLPPADQAAEYLMMSLRLSEGSDLTRLRALDPALPDPTALADLQAEGLVWTTGTCIGTTPAGRRVLNGVLRQLLAG